MDVIKCIPSYNQIDDESFNLWNTSLQRWESYFVKVTRYLLLLPIAKIFHYSYIVPRK